MITVYMIPNTIRTCIPPIFYRYWRKFRVRRSWRTSFSIASVWVKVWIAFQKTPDIHTVKEIVSLENYGFSNFSPKSFGHSIRKVARFTFIILKALRMTLSRLSRCWTNVRMLVNAPFKNNRTMCSQLICVLNC